MNALLLTRAGSATEIVPDGPAANVVSQSERTLADMCLNND